MTDELKPTDLMIWLDLETTGLDPLRDRILEIAMFPSMRMRNDGAVFAHVIPWNGDIRHLDPIVQEMHTKNGLFEDCRDAYTDRDRYQLASELMHTKLDEWADLYKVPRDTKFTLAGSSVHFDLSFLRAWFPRVAARFSHRLYDVSTCKLLCEQLGMPKLPKAEAHRALADTFESFGDANACLKWIRSHF